jgi:hypothetical protein
MNWHYYNGQQQVGPIPEEQLLQLRQSGAVTAETLVWREGLATWGRYADVGPNAAASAAPPISAPPAAQALPGQAMCVECGRYFSTDDLIHHGSAYVCANCKPIFFQKLREGVPPGGAVGVGGVTEAQVRERDYQHDVGAYVSQSWQLLKSDPGLIIGASALVGVCWLVANGLPYLGTITGLIFSGPLLGGLFIFFLKKIRNQAPALGDAFGGFSSKFGQLLLGHVVPSILAGLAVVVPVVLIVIGFVMMSIHGQGRGGGMDAPGPVMYIGIALFIPAFCVMVYLQYCWFFALWLIVDKNMQFWPAMALSRAVVRKHWWMTLWIGFVAGILGLLGLLACGVGLIVSAPVALGVIAYAYEKLFGDMQPAA